MRFVEIFSLIVVMSLAMTATADEEDAIAQDLTELRKQIGEPHSSGTQDFQQAVRDVARDERRNAPSSRNDRRTFNTPDFGTPSVRRTPHPQELRAFSIPHSQGGFPDPVSQWGHPPHHRRPAPTPASRLRETAFELDRLAHGLEMAELYEGADTLRNTAEKLRQSARHVVINPGQHGPAIASPSPAGENLPQ